MHDLSEGEPCRWGAGPFRGDAACPAVATSGATYAPRLRWADADEANASHAGAGPFRNNAPRPATAASASTHASCVPRTALMERRLSMPAPDFPTASRSSGPRPAAVAPPLLPDDGLAVEPAETSGAALPAPKSKLIPVILGGVAVVLLAAGMWGYWRFHRIRTAPAPPPQVAVQTQPATPPPAPTPVESPTPPPAASVEEPTPPVSAPPAVAKKTAAHKPKLANRATADCTRAGATCRPNLSPCS